MRWTLTLIVLVSLLAPLLAAACGDGVCSMDENCSICSLDCGRCNVASCSLDNECYSGICCNGICSKSCVAYPPPKTEVGIGESPYIASILAVGTYSVTLGLIVVAIIAFVLLIRRKKA